MASINKTKLMSLSCSCEVERNNFPDLEIRKKDKCKVLQLFRLQGIKDGKSIDEILIMIKYQKTMDVAIEFGLKEIQAVISQNISKGMLQFVLQMQPKQPQQTAQNLGRNIAINNNFVQSQTVKVFLNNMEVQLAEGFCKLFKGEYERIKSSQKPQQQNNGQNQNISEESKQATAMRESKKRKIEQITNPLQINNNPREKVMKLNSSNQVVKNLKQTQQVQIVQKPKQLIVLKDLPWDLLRIILDYSQQNEVKILKFVDKQFQKLVLQRKSKLVFVKRDIPEKIFFNILSKSTQIKQIIISTNLQKVSPTSFQNNLITLPKLQVLDFLGFSNINETSLTRLVNSCRKYLHTFKLHYGSIGIGVNSMSTLARCPQLKELCLGDLNDSYSQKILGGGSLPYERLACVKKMIKDRKFTLEKLVLYQCDQYILENLALKDERTSLVKLCIGQFIQRNNVKLEEIDALKKFKNINWFNLCGTFYPLQFQIQLPDEQNDQLLSVAGCRELELVFFSMKYTLRYLTIGQYAYDELLNFVSEMCKGLEMLEINSNQITDQGVVPILKKLTKLRTLDIAACPLITGICFYETEEFGIGNLQRFITSVTGFEQQKIKEKLREVAPNCQLELKINKSYILPN